MPLNTSFYMELKWILTYLLYGFTKFIFDLIKIFKSNFFYLLQTFMIKILLDNKIWINKDEREL
ncbi:hypothetical protein AEBR_2052 [Halarcobacter ebronensis]|uniref:Uncharacterized protein n=1 Tax=Halarcobacter ebronensis TaxID=1462615 RepID=A0A4Q1AQ90_9BACT|nr:hypothetical protein AEBR_2052 [Halarcobacter ebronensis]RXK07452.1 hypothetical protein CRV07_03045 [Halarcobacter ebronensis]